MFLDVYHSNTTELVIDTKVRGNPRPTVEWLKDEQPVVLDDRVQQVEHLDGLCELIITKPVPQTDNGVYTCVAKNKLGQHKIVHTLSVEEALPSSRRSSLTLSMLGEDGEPIEKGGKGGKKDQKGKPPKPKKDSPEPEGDSGGGGYERRSRVPDVAPKNNLYFTSQTSNRYVSVGAKVKLTAIVDGKDPTMKWQKNDANVTYGPKIRNQNRDNLAVLEFLSVTEDDAGVYTLIARNDWVEIKSSCTLSVYQPKVNTDVEPVFTRSLKGMFRIFVVTENNLKILLYRCLSLKYQRTYTDFSDTWSTYSFRNLVQGCS